MPLLFQTNSVSAFGKPPLDYVPPLRPALLDFLRKRSNKPDSASPFGLLGRLLQFDNPVGFRPFFWQRSTSSSQESRRLGLPCTMSLVNMDYHPHEARNRLAHPLNMGQNNVPQVRRGLISEAIPKAGFGFPVFLGKTRHAQGARGSCSE